MYPYCRLFWYHSSTDSIQGEQNGKNNLPASAYTCTAQVLVVFSVGISGKLIFQTLAWLLHFHVNESGARPQSCDRLLFSRLKKAT